jgi:hypothetical protein
VGPARVLVWLWREKSADGDKLRHAVLQIVRSPQSWVTFKAGLVISTATLPSRRASHRLTPDDSDRARHHPCIANRGCSFCDRAPRPGKIEGCVLPPPAGARFYDPATALVRCRLCPPYANRTIAATSTDHHHHHHHHRGFAPGARCPEPTSTRTRTVGRGRSSRRRTPSGGSSCCGKRMTWRRPRRRESSRSCRPASRRNWIAGTEDGRAGRPVER